MERAIKRLRIGSPEVRNTSNRTPFEVKSRFDKEQVSRYAAPPVLQTSKNRSSPTSPSRRLDLLPNEIQQLIYLYAVTEEGPRSLFGPHKLVHHPWAGLVDSLLYVSHHVRSNLIEVIRVSGDSQRLHHIISRLKAEAEYVQAHRAIESEGQDKSEITVTEVVPSWHFRYKETWLK